MIALSLEPEVFRYAGATEMRNDIRAARSARSPAAATPTANESLGNEPTQIAATPLAALSPQRTMPEAAREKPRSLGVMISIVWVAAVAIAGVVLFALMRRTGVEESMPASAGAAGSSAEVVESAAPSQVAASASASADSEPIGDAGAHLAPKPTATAKPKPTATSTKKPPAPTVKKKK
jgi:hypothetical protein